MPDLPELEICARLLDEELSGCVIESTLAPGINALRTIQPLLRELHGRAIEPIDRRGKRLLVHVGGGLHLVPAPCCATSACDRRDRPLVGDQIHWTAQLSPFRRATDLTEADSARLRDAIVQRLGEAIELYRRTLTLPLPDKLPIPLLVHRHAGEPCPRCGTNIEAVHHEDYVM